MSKFDFVVGKLTYANVAATLALCLAMGGTAAYAAALGKNTVGSKQIVNKSITAKDVKPDSLTGDQLGNGSVTGADIADGSLSGADVAGDSLGGGQINEQTLGAVPNAAALGGVPASSFSRSAGHIKGAFSEANSLNLNIAGFGTVRLVCDDLNTASVADDQIAYGYNLSVGAGGVGLSRISTSGFPFDPPVWRMSNSDAFGNGTTTAQDAHMDIEHYLSNGDGSKAVMIYAWGYNDIPNPGCNGVIEAEQLR